MEARGDERHRYPVGEVALDREDRLARVEDEPVLALDQPQRVGVALALAQAASSSTAAWPS